VDGMTHVHHPAAAVTAASHATEMDATVVVLEVHALRPL